MIVMHIFSSWFFLQLCDISLRVGITSLSAHRVVLAAASPYFHAMFNGKFCMPRRFHFNRDVQDYCAQ